MNILAFKIATTTFVVILGITTIAITLITDPSNLAWFAGVVIGLWTAWSLYDTLAFAFTYPANSMTLPKVKAEDNSVS